MPSALLRRSTVKLCCCSLLSVTFTALAADPATPAWMTEANSKGPLTATEAQGFARQLAQYVYDGHLKQRADSPQRGMIYEYFDVKRRGEADQWVQGEALDTMHDGAWFAAAMAAAHRATGDAYYREFLVRWQLPFYLKMLNESDQLFSPARNDAGPGAVQFGKEHLLQAGEKGFVPYFWDDGGSVSLERRQKKQPLGFFACHDALAGQPNPQFLLSGYSLGSSNHLAQDLALMLELAWLDLRESPDEALRQLATQTATGAANLQACRMRHQGYIPLCTAAAALTTGDAALMQKVPALDGAALWNPSNPYYQGLYAYKPGQKFSLAGFADNQAYEYYQALARHGTLPRPLAFRLTYEAYTARLLFESYYDDAPLPAGINRFDLHPFTVTDGKHADYRSDRKGPGGKPRPIGSRMGPQNMAVCGWALQALKAMPGVWEERAAKYPDDHRVWFNHEGERKPPAQGQLMLGDVHLTLASTFRGLKVTGSAPHAGADVKWYAQPDKAGRFGQFEIRPAGVTARNNAGAALIVEDEQVGSKNERLSFSFLIPYTVAKGQAEWANGVEHGRYSIAVGDQHRNVYLASREADVLRQLGRELGEGLRTWQAIFQEYGFIPTGIDAGGEWHKFSDSGGYAHLIQAATQWSLYQQNQRDWEMWNVPSIK